MKVDLSRTLPETSENRWWSIEACARVRGAAVLKEKLRQEILKKGHVDQYPYERFLVGHGKWTVEKMKHHSKAVQALDKINTLATHTPEVEKFSWLDKYGNQEEYMHLNFVSGPIVDFIEANPRQKAIDGLKEMILNNAQSKSKNLKSFQDAAQRHAERLVDAVRAVK